MAFISRLVYPLLLCATHTALASSFSGFSISAAVGGTQVQADIDQLIDVMVEGFINPTYPSNIKITEMGAAGLLGIGYDYTFRNGFYLGVAATASLADIQVERDLHFTAKGNTPITLNSAFTLTLENDFALLFKPGYVWDNSTLFYLLLGPRWGQFKSDIDTQFSLIMPLFFLDAFAEGAAHENVYALGFTAGLGIEQEVHDHVSLSLEYAFSRYVDIDIPNITSTIFNLGVPGGTVTEHRDVDVNTNTVMLGLTYRF